jgi:hypothetical protein
MPRWAKDGDTVNSACLHKSGGTAQYSFISDRMLATRPDEVLKNAQSLSVAA